MMKMTYTTNNVPRIARTTSRVAARTINRAVAHVLIARPTRIIDRTFSVDDFAFDCAARVFNDPIRAERVLAAAINRRSN